MNCRIKTVSFGFYFTRRHVEVIFYRSSHQSQQYILNDISFRVIKTL